MAPRVRKLNEAVQACIDAIGELACIHRLDLVTACKQRAHRD